MTKKHINIILVVLVLGLWGFIGYKTINQYFWEKPYIDIKKVIYSDIMLSKIRKDTFQIKNIERDPFLNTKFANYNKKIIYATPSKKIKPKPVVETKINVDWPSISYHGYIRSKDKTEELILIMINKKLYKIRKNNDINGIKLYKIYKDSVELILNKQKKIIPLHRI